MKIFSIFINEDISIYDIFTKCNDLQFSNIYDALLIKEVLNCDKSISKILEIFANISSQWINILSHSILIITISFGNLYLHVLFNAILPLIYILSGQSIPSFSFMKISSFPVPLNFIVIKLQEINGKYVIKMKMR